MVRLEKDGYYLCYCGNYHEGNLGRAIDNYWNQEPKLLKEPEKKKKGLMRYLKDEKAKNG